ELIMDEIPTNKKNEGDNSDDDDDEIKYENDDHLFKIPLIPTPYT
ncbi:unnamed protein product, partial [Rotaria sp. Silwood1]